MTSELPASIDRIGHPEWDRLLPQFHDATIYQTWSYGAGRWGSPSLSHLVLMRDDVPVGLAQVAVRRVPLLGAGIAYVPWGPLWRRDGTDPEVFRALVRALRDEYSERRGLLLRIAPHEHLDPTSPVAAILVQEGYRRTADFYRTLLIDLRQSPEELRRQMSRRWRRALDKAEHLGLQIEEGTSDDLYAVFKGIHRDMVRRKGFVPAVDVDQFQQIQHELPDGLKMHILVCRQEDRPTAALMASAIGDTGVGLLGATATEGLSSGSFHLLNVRMMAWLKERGALYYDFGGYDPVRNRGTARFKDGLRGADVSFVGRYEVCSSRLSGPLVGLAERLRDAVDLQRERRAAMQAPRGLRPGSTTPARRRR